METSMKSSKIALQALNLFVVIAAVVFATSLVYCYLTRHFTEMGIVFGAISILAFLIIDTYKSLKAN